MKKFLKKIKILLIGLAVRGLIEVERSNKRKMVKSLTKPEDFQNVLALTECGILSLLDIKLGIHSAKTKAAAYQKAGYPVTNKIHVCSMCDLFKRKNHKTNTMSNTNCARWYWGGCPKPKEVLKGGLSWNKIRNTAT